MSLRGREVIERYDYIERQRAAITLASVSHGQETLTFSGFHPCPVEEGEVLVLKTEEVRSDVGSTQVPVVELRVTSKPRRTRKGEWRVDFVLIDHRPHLLRRVPPALDPRRARRDTSRPPTRTDIERAAQESAYTRTDRLALIDAGEAVPDEVQRRFSAEARGRSAETLSATRAEDWRRRQERAVRSRLAETLSVLPPDRGAELLARIERDIEEFRDAA